MFQKGNKLGKGRPTKADEEKANYIFITALKILYGASTDDEAKISFIHNKLMKSERGQLFVAEHIFGKPKERIEVTKIKEQPLFGE